MYPHISQKEVDAAKFAQPGLYPILQLLAEFSQDVISDTLVAGATGVTVSAFAFKMPVRGKLISAKAITQVVQTGSGNTPVVQVLKGTTVIAASGAIALAGAIGDGNNIVVDSTKQILEEGDVVNVAIVNPTATITVPMQVKVQIEWAPYEE
jgi:hypothetical protein